MQETSEDELADTALVPEQSTPAVSAHVSMKPSDRMPGVNLTKAKRDKNLSHHSATKHGFVGSTLLLKAI